MITFAPVQAKFVRITQTGTAEPPVNWSIQRLRLFEVEYDKITNTGFQSTPERPIRRDAGDFESSGYRVAQ